MSSSGRYLSAQEAAEDLGVNLKTLYAYVSRGLIRSEAVGGKRRNRRYRAEDVRRLRERKEHRKDPSRATEGALDWGTPVLESEITLIADGRLYYRGHDAIVLSRQRSLEEVARLIWTGTIPDQASEIVPELFQRSGVNEAADRIHGERRQQSLSADVFGIALQQAAIDDPVAYDLRPVSVGKTGARVLHLLTATATGGSLRHHNTCARTLQEVWLPELVDDTSVESLINQALILCADHEFNVSSFTARCVASAGATPYAVVIAGLQALSGVRHGGNTDRVEAMLREARTGSSVRDTLADRMRRGEPIFGFGHHLYPDGDPRAEAILQALASARPDSETLALASEVSDHAAELVGERPNLDFALAVLARTLGLPAGGAFTLFAVGRTVGWIGHAIEQYESEQLIRPRARYVGAPPSTPQALQG